MLTVLQNSDDLNNILHLCIIYALTILYVNVHLLIYSIITTNLIIDRIFWCIFTS